MKKDILKSHDRCCQYKVYAKVGQNPLIRSQDIKRKEILMLFKGHNSTIDDH